MKTHRFETLLILAITMISFQSLAAIERPMKAEMSYIINNVLNAESNTGKLEAEPYKMNNYQLFVYVGPNCQSCKVFIPSLSQLAQDYKKKLNVVLVYHYKSENLASSKDQFAKTATYEFYDEQGLMYHRLFTQTPGYMSYVVTGPTHTILAESKFTNSQDIINFESWLKKKN